MNEWWYMADGARKGPVLEQELRRMLLEGVMPRNTVVCRTDSSSWTPVSEIGEFSVLMHQIAPEICSPKASEEAQALPLAGAWRRFFARMVDSWVIGVPTAVAVGLLLSSLWPAAGEWLAQYVIVFYWIVLPLMLAVEAMIFALCGKTPGKALLGVTVITHDGRYPDARRYFRRQVGVYWYGLGIGFPLVNILAHFRQYRRVAAGQPARYDRGAFIVKARKLGIGRVLVAVLVCVGVYLSPALLYVLNQ